MPSPSAPWTKNRRMAVMLLGVTALFFGFGFAQVPHSVIFLKRHAVLSWNTNLT